MDKIQININIAGRVYPLSIPANEEETLRRVGKQIENMIKYFETNFEVKDKQDALAMCAFKLGTDAEINKLANEKSINFSNERILHLNTLLEDEK